MVVFFSKRSIIVILLGEFYSKGGLDMLKSLQTKKHLHHWNKKAKSFKRNVMGNSKLALAGLVAAGFSALSTGKKVFGNIISFTTGTSNKHVTNKGDNRMKKSTALTILVVFAAIAGALAALYCYILRREKELDEYEQLLFSEDFNDEISADFLNDDQVEEDNAAPEAKTTTEPQKDTKKVDAPAKA